VSIRVSFFSLFQLFIDNIELQGRKRTRCEEREHGRGGSGELVGVGVVQGQPGGRVPERGQPESALESIFVESREERGEWKQLHRYGHRRNDKTQRHALLAERGPPHRHDVLQSVQREPHKIRDGDDVHQRALGHDVHQREPDSDDDVHWEPDENDYSDYSDGDV
jgi:hypothetical protein